MCSTTPPRYRVTMGEREILRAVGHLQSVAERYVGGFGEGAATVDDVRAALTTGADPTGIIVYAVRELHSFSADPAVITRAAARFTQDPDHPVYPLAAQLLARAGADLEAAAQWWKANQPTGWNPPQADPALHQTLRY